MALGHALRRGSDHDDVDLTRARAESYESPSMLSRLAPVLVVAVTLALFAPIVGYDFVTWDDPDFVYANPRLFPATPESVTALWREPNALTFTTYVVLSVFPSDGPINPMAVHATSLLLHAIATLAAWALLVRLVGDPVGATAGAL